MTIPSAAIRVFVEVASTALFTSAIVQSLWATFRSVAKEFLPKKSSLRIKNDEVILMNVSQLRAASVEIDDIKGQIDRLIEANQSAYNATVVKNRDPQ